MSADGGDSDGEVEVGRERGSKRTGEDGRGREREGAIGAIGAIDAIGVIDAIET